MKTFKPDPAQEGYNAQESAFPAAYKLMVMHDLHISRQRVFDPALKGFERGFRFSEPVFADAHIRQRWLAARAAVMAHVLYLISGSRWADHLMLRGSLPLKFQLGTAARTPRDIDFVFMPDDLKVQDALPQALLQELPALLRQNAVLDDTVIDADSIVTDEIWAYDRASGRRLTFLWQSGSLPQGSMQIDIVFNEQLPVAGEPMELGKKSGVPFSLRVAPAHLALAWKILWLETDMYSEGKDLYDATLLAEKVKLDRPLLQQLLANCHESYARLSLSPETMIMNLPIHHWDDFVAEYPWVSGSAESWKQRLCAALAG